MSYWAHLEETTAKPWCSFGKPDWRPQYDGDEQCSEPCYPSVTVERHADGGTYVLGGTSEAELNVTYNYSADFRRAWESAGGSLDGHGDGTLGAMLGGKRASDVASVLSRAVEILGTERDDDYWKATPGNAGHALSILRDWAQQHPDAVFRIS